VRQGAIRWLLFALCHRQDDGAVAPPRPAGG
jgi:hypothetical protein